LNTLQGGKFGHGFLSAGVTEALSPAIGAASSGGGAGGVVAGTVASAVVGGTVSELSGWKFGNGAQTGAFQFLFNHVVHSSGTLGGFAKEVATGFGEGVYSALTLGYGSLDDVRSVAGLYSYETSDSVVFDGSFTAGSIQGGFAGGGALGLIGRGRAGMQWSHWIPDRYIREFTPSGRLSKYYKPWLDSAAGRWFVNSNINGNAVPTLFHQFTDNFAYQFMSPPVKLALRRLVPFPSVVQQPLRVPLAGYGAAAGAMNQNGN